MSKIVLALVAVSAGLGLWNLQLAHQARASKATVVALQAKVASLEEQKRNAEARAARSIESFAPELAVSTAHIEPPKKNPADSTNSGNRVAMSGANAVMNQAFMPSSEDRMRMMRESRERQHQLMQDPEYRDAMRLQAKNGIARSYPGVTEELGLDGQQADEFFGLLADQQMRVSEALEPMWDLDGRNDPAAIQEQQRKVQQRSQELQRKSETEIAQRFGQDKLQAWKDYQSTLGVRHQLEGMRSTLSAQGLPLGEQSNKAMLRALAEVQKAEMEDWLAANRGAGQGGRIQATNAYISAAAPSAQNFERGLEISRKRNQRTLDAISPYLSYEQRSAIEKELQAQLKLQEAQLRIMKAQGPITVMESTNGSR